MKININTKNIFVNSLQIYVSTILFLNKHKNLKKNKKCIIYLLTEEDLIDHEILVPKKILIDDLVNTTILNCLYNGLTLFEC